MHLPLGTFFSFAGEIKLYKAEDSGEKKHLASIQAPKLLPLKVSCPVMLSQFIRTLGEWINRDSHRPAR